jgi:hypothetical protein
MTDSKQPGFWHTLPGVLTALAGVITAVTGLIVAATQLQSRSGQTSAAQHAPLSAQTAGASQPAAASVPRTDSLSSTAGNADPSVVESLTLGPPREARFEGGTLVFGVLAATLEPFNRETRLLNVRLRINNEMKVFDRSYYAELRAVADGLPQAPLDPPLEQIEAHSVKDLLYTFRLPAATRSLALRITREEQVVDIPLHLK